MAVTIDGSANTITAAATSATTATSATSLTTATGSAPSYSARAWVNFNGTGTVAIRASGNVSSITDNGVGDYTINFTNAMSDANYTPVFGGSAAFGLSVAGSAWFAGLRTTTAGGAPTLKSTSQMQIGTAAGNTAIVDAPDINVSIFN